VEFTASRDESEVKLTCLINGCCVLSSTGVNIDTHVHLLMNWQNVAAISPHSASDVIVLRRIETLTLTVENHLTIIVFYWSVRWTPKGSWHFCFLYDTSAKGKQPVYKFKITVN